MIAISIQIHPLTPPRINDLAALFATNDMTARCWCMWWRIAVKQFHANGGEVNKQTFSDLAATAAHPLGLLAYAQNEPIGWCAAGPRSHFARAINTPSFKGRDPYEDDSVWFVPCFFVKKEHRNQGISQALLEHAVKLAKQHNATAIEGFPFSSGKRRSGGGVQVGFESAFAACGFELTRVTSSNRVVVRRELSS